MTCPSCRTATLTPEGRCTTCGYDVAAATIAASSVTIAAATRVAAAGVATITPPGAFAGAGDVTMPPRATTAHAAGAASAVLEPGRFFGSRYHIIALLGAGGMGAVYQAWDSELNVVVALKVIRSEIAADPRAAAIREKQFKSELLLARQVTHKNVVRIHDLGEIDGVKYITMPYIHGKDLATISKETGPLGVTRSLKIARDIASGLAAAHEAAVVHRDLKPANIMVAADDVAFILDFGIASPSAQSDAGNEIVGTPEYMAPEQARAGPIDQRADVYAFGLILYEMLVGRRKSTAAGHPLADVRARTQEGVPRPRTIDSSIPEALDDLVARCLESDPAARFQTSAELVATLDRLDDQGLPIAEPRRLTWKMVAAAAVLVVAMSGGTYYFTRRAVQPAKQHEPVSVVIADFKNTTGDATFDRTLEPMLRRALQTSSFISAYDHSAIAGTLGIRPPDALDETAARELAVKQGLGIVLSGTIDRQGSGYAVSVKAARSVTGAVVVDKRTRASSKNDVLSVASKLVTGVRNALGDDVPESAQLFAMRSISASSLEVVGYYAAAVEAQALGKFEDARQSYLKAVQVDPQFGIGYQGLAVMSRNLGRNDDADKYIKEALRHLDGMTGREVYGTRGFYYRMIGDNQLCAKEYADSLAKYPGDSVAHNQRAACLAKLRNMKEAMAEMQQAALMLPNHRGYRENLALLAALAGNFDQAEAEVKKLANPDAHALQTLAYSQVGRGMLQEATETYQKMATMGAAGASSAASGLGDLAAYRGRFADAIRIFEEGAAADLAAKNADKAAIKFASSAYARLMAGQRGPAVAAADQALRNSKSMAATFLAARIFVEAGAIEKATPLAESLSAELPAEPQAHGKIIEGLIALKQGHARDAIKTLTEANGLLDTWFGHFDLGRAYLAAGAFPQADSEFDRCIARRGEALSLMDEGPTYGQFPPVYYDQGRVREQLGTEKFADSYREYLKIRAGAQDDPLLPEVRRRAGN